MYGRLTCRSALVVLGAVSALSGADRSALGQSSPEPRLPRDKLLLFRGTDGTVQPARSVEDWLKRRGEIVRGMQTVMGRLPGDEKRCPLDVQVEEEVDCGSYVRRLITYASEPGSRVPAYLLVPKAALEPGAPPRPAILCLHGTNHVVGHGVVVGLGDRPNRGYAAELAERGYVTLAPNYPLLAKYQPDLAALGWESGTLKAVWDNLRGLDLLESLPYVKRGAFGAIGHSLGGHNAVYTSVFDERIRVVVSSCGLDSYLDYYDGDERVWLPEKGWTQTRYMPRLADYRGRLAEIPFDFHELIGVLAPRHVLIIAPVNDHNFRADSVDRIAAAAGPVFELHGHRDRLRVEHPDCEHDFPPEMREAAYELFDAVLAFPASRRASEPRPPEGFRALFNGRDLAGWHGLNPHSAARLTGERREANLAQQRADFPGYWTVENGELVNDGRGPYATTDEEFGDIELLIEYRTVPGADSGIYLRGTPQVQIWDWNQPFDPGRPARKPHLGSGGLFNNTPGAAGRDPLLRADRPFGEWNQFRIRQIGDRTWVWLNDQLVVDGAVMENYWDRRRPLPARGPIMLQTHGGEIRWRNIFVREIAAGEAQQILNAADAETKARLARALTLHASFDEGLDADFARGDRTCYVVRGRELVKAAPTDEVRLAPGAGRFGGGLHFTKKSDVRPAFRDAGVLGYNDRSWSASVSVWLRLNPDEDLEPGYCDPVQIIGDDSRKGFIFLEWSKDETPRFFRYAIRPLFPIWNPDNVGWEEIPAAKRPMVQVERAPFSRDAWTHAVFTLENVNDKSQPQAGRLYLNGKPQGTIENWDLTLGWEPDHVRLVLGAAYVGHLDDLAVFDRALTDGEVRHIYGLEQGIRDLR